MSFGETVFLFVLALIVFGPKKLPEIARQVGKYLAELPRLERIQVADRAGNRTHRVAGTAEDSSSDTGARRNREPQPESGSG